MKKLFRSIRRVLPCAGLLMLLAVCGAAHAANVSGTVFEDTDADLGGTGPGIGTQTVRLFNSAGTQVQTTTTAAGGTYTFAGVTNGVYYVAIDAPTVTSSGTTGVLGEQTYASAGTGNGGTIVTNYGSLCVIGTPPTYTDQGATTTTNTSVNNSANGACYGGRRGSIADSGTTTINSKEHVTRINITANNDVTSLDFGFSFNVVTSINDSGQGSLRQFMTNANAIAGANAMRFVPAVATNTTSGGSWWRIALASNLAPVAAGNGDGTRIEGTAYSKADGSTVLDTNAGDLRPATVVGYLADQATIPAPGRPELQIDRAATSTASFLMPVIHVQAADVAVRNVSITSGTESILVNSNGVTGLLIEDNALGVTPANASAMPSTWNGGSDSGTNFAVTSAANCSAVSSTGTVRHNVLMAPSFNLRLCGNAVSYAISFNFSLAAVGSPFAGAGVGLATWGSFSTLPTTCTSNNSLVNNQTASARLVQAMCGSNNVITGNTVLSGNAVSITVRDATGLLVRGNVVTGHAFGPPVSVQAANASVGQQVQITQNSFANNPGNGIDLNLNGVTTVTATGGNCPSSGLANGGLPRPRITSNLLSGTTLTVSGNYCNTGTYRLEFFKVAAGNAGDVGADTLQAGEGEIYLGALTGQTGGTFTNSAVTIPAGSLAIGDSITAVAIREDGATTAGNSSEFSANATVGVVVSGTVFQDSVGDLLTDGAAGSAGNPALAGRTVRLFNSAGTQLQTATTAADGTYTFTGVVNGVHYLAVDAPITDASGTAGVLGEQTYASTGTGNGGTIGTNYGSLCVMGTPPTYTDQGATTTTNTPVDNSATGACYGGRRGVTADSGTTTINSKEHVVRINVLDNSISAVDFGFSFNVVTNVNDAGQGSLRQFIINGNAIAGSNAMRFVPAMASNTTSGGSWWRVALASNLTAITAGNGAGTSIDGIAYSKADGSTVLDTNPGDLRPATAVGYLTDQATIPAIARPELQIDRAAAGFTWTFPVIYVQAANVAVRNASITNGTESILVNTNGVTNLVIENNALGMTPAGAIARPSAPDGGGGNSGTNVWVRNTASGVSCGALNSTGTINHNVLTSWAGNVHLCGNGVSYSITSNFSVMGTGFTIWGGNIGNPTTCGSNNSMVHNHVVTTTVAWAFCGSNNEVIGNTGVGSRIDTLDATGLLVRGNVITGSTFAPAVRIRTTNASVGHRVQVTQNSFSNNAGNAIDLNTGGVTTATATGGNCPSSGSANGGLPRPRITSASLAGTTLTVSGNYCNTGTYRLEFYKVAAGATTGDIGSDTLQAGEGEIYLGALTGLTGGTFTNQSVTIPASTLANGDSITAIAIREDGATTTGNTSEFSANALIGVAINGTVFQDSVGDLLADGAVGSAGNPGLAGRTVRLFNSAGTQLQTAVTAADGTYTFTGVVNGVHYLAVDAPIVDASGTASVLGEQTYASAGTGNGGTAGTNFGSLCVMGTPPTYTDQGATTTTNTSVDNSATGACYGGRRGATADSGTTTINTKEHVVRINVLDNSITAVDFGFSFNVVTSVNDAGQGSLRQFITNANAIAGANAMRFVPAVVPNAGGATWWRVALASNLPAIAAGNGAATSIDGTAYSKADGSTVLDTNAGDLQAATTVGYLTDQATIPAIPRPELQIDRVIITNTGTSWGLPVIHVQAADVAVRNVSLTFGSESILVNSNGVTNLLIENNALGITPNGAQAWPTTWSGVGDSGRNVSVANSNAGSCSALNSTGMIRSNVMASPGPSVALCGNGVAYTISSNIARAITGHPNGTKGQGLATWGSSLSLPATCVSNSTVINNLLETRVIAFAACGSNNMIVGNTINTITAGDIVGIFVTDATGLLIRGNVIANMSPGAGVQVRQATAGGGQRVQITQNSFFANASNAIDLNNNGVTINTATGGNCPSSGAANGGLPRPQVTSASVAGTTLTVSGNYCNTGTYRLEFYKVAAGNAGDVGTDTLQAGEGESYLGALTGQTGGTFTNATVTVPAGVLANGNSITAIAIREDGATTAGNTSEFSANVVVGVALSGTVFQDTVGDLLADGAVGGAGNPGIAGRTVRLFNSVGTQLQTTVTAANGTYAFSSVTNGVYYVAVDAPIVDASGTAGVLGEQTYASAGTGNSGTAGTSFGSLCVMGTPPTYTDQGATTTTNTPVDNSATGACYGGRRGATADSGTTTIDSKEHVVRINVLDNSITAVDFGFSFNVVTNINDAGQGSVRQFIANANTIAGANAMRFVPAVSANAGAWWRVTLSSLLPAISGANGASTIIDGTAYYKTDGTNVYDFNPGTLMPATSVGTGADQATIPALDRPELEVFKVSSAAFGDVANPIFEVAASNVTIRKTSITGGSSSVLMRTAGVTGMLIQDNALGTDPSGTANIPLATTSNGGNIKIGFGAGTCPGIAGTRGLIDHNLMRSESAAIAMCNLTGNALGDWVIQNNFALQSARVLMQPGAFYGGVSSATANTTVRNNYLTGGTTGGINLPLDNAAGGHRILGNTITGNGTRGVNIGNVPGNILVRGNVISNNGGAGIGIRAAATVVQNHISQNSFIGNGGNAIDLGNNGVSLNTNACTASATGGANGDLARPVITAATLTSSTTLQVSATYCGTGSYTLEFYKVAAGNAGDVGSDSLQAGEGQIYLGSLTGLSSGTVTNGAVAIAAGTLTNGDSLTAIAIRSDGASTAGNTSEFSPNVVVPLTVAARVTLTKATIRGVGTFVFNGEAANANGFPTNSSYALTTTAANTPVTGAQVNLAAANVITDIKETLPAGWALTSVTCTDANAAGSGNPTGTLTPQVLNSDTIRIAAENVKPNADLRCTVTNTLVGFTLTGKVILDDGATGGTAHDAIQNGAETGRVGVTLSLTNCGATTYGTATTDANGAFTLGLLGVPAGPVCLVKTPTAAFLSVSANIGTTGGAYNRTTDTLAFTLAANTSYTGVVLGEVAQSRLTTDGAQQVEAGGSVTYAHTFVPGTAAQVTFSTTDAPSPAVPGWGSLLYRDVNCDALLDGGDTLLPAPIVVTVGQTICLLNRVTSPAGATNGMSDVTTVTASEMLSLSTITPNTLTIPHTRMDTTTIGQAGLTLIKQVRKIAVCPANAAASQLDATAWTTSNTALPGQLLEYRIIYRNDTTAPVTQVKVHDTVTAYTRFKGAMCLETPATGIAGCSVTSAPAADATSGTVEWTLADAAGPLVGLQPGATGSVGYCQQVMP